MSSCQNLSRYAGEVAAPKARRVRVPLAPHGQTLLRHAPGSVKNASPLTLVPPTPSTSPAQRERL
jgi:hypothetical protein